MDGDWTEDTRLLLARARRHQIELSAILNGDQPPALWSIEETRKADRTYSYALIIDSSRLKAAKPVAADLANNLVHTLDQAVGAIGRLCGQGRERRIYFPWTIDDTMFESELGKLQFLRPETVRAILDARQKNRTRLPFAQIVKEVSNSGKHWALIPSKASVKAVAVNLPGKPQKIWTVPDEELDDFYYPFCDSPERMVGPFQMLVGIRFYGFEPEVMASPESIFSETLRYVDDMVMAMCGPEWPRETSEQ